MKNETNHLPIVLARKPLSEKTIVDNVLRWGTGGINIDGCRIGYAEDDKTKNIVNYNYNLKDKQSGVMYNNYDDEIKPSTGHKEKMMVFNNEGRFPANIIFDEEAGQLLDEQSGDSKSVGGTKPVNKNYIYKEYKTQQPYFNFGDTGGASRFFYNVNLINEDKINKQINEKGKRMKNENVKLMLGDNIEKLRELPDNFVDSIITDPPYGLSFMNKKWDYDVPSIDFWKEALRVLKPGGHVLSFGGTRTYHRMVVNMEDAGFEIRDQIMWVYGSGFPKSHNIGKAIDKIEGNDREIVREETTSFKVNNTKENNVINVGTFANNFSKQTDENGYRINTITKGQSDYEGWGTALKPANEPICVARKPLSEKTIAENVLKHGTGGINIDGCRIGTDDKLGRDNKTTPFQSGNNWSINNGISKGIETNFDVDGRFPANLIIECTCDEVIPGNKGEVKKSNGRVRENHKYNSVGNMGSYDGEGTIDNYNDKGDIHTNPDCPCRLLDEQSGDSKSSKGKERKVNNVGSFGGGTTNENNEYNDTGGASRFFYVPKVSKKERNMGLDNFEDKSSVRVNAPRDNEEEKTKSQKNNHPTIKPINLLTYLVRLITPQNGIVMDCYMGSGSTGIAALLEGFQFIGMEMDEEYFNIAEARIDSWEQYKDLIKKK